MTIQKFMPYNSHERPFPVSSQMDGDYVLYTDHLAAIAEKDQQLNRLMNQLAVLVADNAKLREALDDSKELNAKLRKRLDFYDQLTEAK